MELESMTALELAAKIRQREVSVLDGVKEVFDQIESKEDKVHAYLDTYKKEAYARAKEVEKGIADGTYTGPLAGVPIAIKDNICICLLYTSDAVLSLLPVLMLSLFPVP